MTCILDDDIQDLPAEYVDSIHLCQLDRRWKLLQCLHLPFQCMWWGHVPKISKPFSGKCPLPQSTKVVRVIPARLLDMMQWAFESRRSSILTGQIFLHVHSHALPKIALAALPSNPHIFTWIQRAMQKATNCNCCCCCCCCCCLLPVTRCWLRKIFWHQSSITVDLAGKHEKSFCRS